MEYGLLAGAKGTVLLIYEEPHLPIGYEVEFLDETGNTLAVVTLNGKDIEKIPAQASS